MNTYLLDKNIHNILNRRNDYILHRKRLKSISSNRGINYERTVHPEFKKNYQNQWDNNRKFEKAEKEREIYKYNKVVNNTIQKIGETDINHFKSRAIDQYKYRFNLNELKKINNNCKQKKIDEANQRIANRIIQSKSTICKKDLDNQYSHLKKIISDKRLYDNDANLKASKATNSIIQNPKCKGIASQYLSENATINNMYSSNRDRSAEYINSATNPKSRYKSHNRFDANSVDATNLDRHRVRISSKIKITTNTFMSRTTSRDMHRGAHIDGNKKMNKIHTSSLSRDYHMNKTKTDSVNQNTNSARKYEGNSKSIDIHGLVKIKNQLKSKSKSKLKGEKSVNVDVNDVALDNTFGSMKNSKKSGDLKSIKSNLKIKANQSPKSKNSLKNNSFMSKKSNTKLSEKNFSDKFEDEDDEGDDDFEDSNNATKKQKS